MENSTHIHWFRNDLRLHDQEFIHLLKDKNQFLGVYILNPADFALTQFGFRKTGLLRLQWLRESLLCLQQNLRLKGSELLVLNGNPHSILPELVTRFDASLSYSSIPASEEMEVEKQLHSKLDTAKIFKFSSGSLVDENLIIKAFSNFTKFRFFVEKDVEKLIPDPTEKVEVLPKSPLVAPTIKVSKRSLHPKTAVPFVGGENSALEHLNAYFANENLVKQYKKDRNGLIGKDFSSKFSVFLANGTLSARTIFRAIKDFEEFFDKNEGSHWIFVELLWRDYFRLCAKWYGNHIFYYSGYSGNRVKKCGFHQKSFDKWKNGQTGNSFIDANMTELKETGFQSNRGRQNTASFLFHDLGIDWRAGAAWFEHALLDYDVFSNQGNWQYIVGAGADPKGGRKFDVDWQAKHYDEFGTYQKLWEEVN